MSCAIRFLKKYDDTIDVQPLLLKFLAVLYDIGMIGFKESSTKILYAHENYGTVLTENNMDVKYKFYVHKMFHLALGTITSRNDSKA